MNASFYIARRYLISKNGKNAINIINILSFIITIVGTAALFIVLSGFAGLKDYTTAFSSYFDPDLKVTPLVGKVVSIPLSRKRNLEQLSGIELVAPVLEEKVFLNYNQKNDIAVLKGVPDNYAQIVQADSILLSGTWLTGNDVHVVVGAGIAQDLSLAVDAYGNYLQIMVPKPGTQVITAFNLSSSFNTLDAIATGEFTVNENLDNTYIFSTLSAARKLLNYKNDQASAVEIKLKPNADLILIKKQVQEIYGDKVIVKDAYELNGSLYKMLNSEYVAVYLIFTLVLIIALFNVVGSIIMMILDKKKNLKTLLDIGASVKMLRQVFFIQGSVMSIAGGIVGILIGIAVVAVQLKFKILYIAPDIPYPIAMNFSNIALSFTTIAVLGIIASYIGSYRINRRLLDQAKV